MFCRRPAIVAQWLDIPALDLTIPQDESMISFGKEFGLDYEDMLKFVTLYVAAQDVRNPYVSPLLAPSLEELPSALITVGGCDPLRDQGERYGRALEAAGVRVRLSRWHGHLHGTMSLTTLAPSSLEYENEVVEGLRQLMTD
jgi:acetyl esterase